VRVESIEVSGDDRHRNGQRQYTGDGARGSDEASQRALRHLVSVADRCHGDDGPPERVRYAFDLRLRHADLGIVEGARVDEHADGECHEEHAQTFHACFEGHYQHLQHQQHRQHMVHLYSAINSIGLVNLRIGKTLFVDACIYKVLLFADGWVSRTITGL